MSQLELDADSKCAVFHGHPENAIAFEAARCPADCTRRSFYIPVRQRCKESIDMQS